MANSESLVVLWTRGDKDFAEEMAFVYTLNAARQDWWDAVTLLGYPLGGSTNRLRLRRRVR